MAQNPASNELLLDELAGFGGIALPSVKGGVGSGHHGHRGRPGERGGSAPSGAGAVYADRNPAPATKREIDDVFHLNNGDPKQRARVKSVLDAIGGVHGIDPRIKDVSVTFADLGQGKLGVTRFSASGDASIVLRGGTSVTESVLAHQIGHVIDHAVLGIGGGNPQVGSALASAIEAWKKAVAQSDYTATLREIIENDIPDADVTALAQPGELWARSYAQYIGRQSGNEEIRGQLTHFTPYTVQETAYAPLQWDERDFVPIEKAIDQIFVAVGWKSGSTKSMKGGAGSGNFDHDGRPGLVGGSAPNGGGGGGGRAASADKQPKKKSKWQQHYEDLLSPKPKKPTPEQIRNTALTAATEAAIGVHQAAANENAASPTPFNRGDDSGYGDADRTPKIKPKKQAYDPANPGWQSDGVDIRDRSEGVDEDEGYGDMGAYESVDDDEGEDDGLLMDETVTTAYKLPKVQSDPVRKRWIDDDAVLTGVAAKRYKLNPKQISALNKVMELESPAIKQRMAELGIDKEEAYKRIAEARTKIENNIAPWEAHQGDTAWLTEREKLHLKIVDDIFAGKYLPEGTPLPTPVAAGDTPLKLFMAGLPGAGKSSIAVAPEFGGRDKNMIVLNSDDYKEALAHADGHADLTWQPALYAAESSKILKMAAARALQEGYNVSTETTFNDEESFRKRHDLFKQAGYDTEVNFVDTPLETSIERAITRFLGGGRFVDPAFIQTFGRYPHELYDRIKNVPDRAQKWNTTDQRWARLVEESKREGYDRKTWRLGKGFGISTSARHNRSGDEEHDDLSGEWGAYGADDMDDEPDDAPAARAKETGRHKTDDENVPVQSETGGQDDGRYANEEGDLNDYDDDSKFDDTGRDRSKRIVDEAEDFNARALEEAVLEFISKRGRNKGSLVNQMAGRPAAEGSPHVERVI